jgi:hypothetical protein
MLSKGFSTSFIVPSKYFQQTTVELEPFYLDEENIDDSIRYKFCSSLNIIDDSKYHFEYRRIDTFSFHVFAMDNSVKSINKYLNLYYEPLLYKNLYNTTLDTDNDIFINIEPKNSFVTYYRDSNYIFSKNINDFVDEHFYENEPRQNIEKILTVYDDNNIEKLTKIFKPLSEVILSIKKIYQVHDEKNIYINFNCDVDDDIYTFLSSFVYKNIRRVDIDKDFLMKKATKNKNVLNFSNKKNYKDQIIKGSSLLVASTILSLMYPLYLTYENYKVKKDVDSIKSQFEQIDTSVKNINQTIDKYKSQKVVLLDRLEKEKLSRDEIINKIKDVYYYTASTQKVRLLVDITKNINDYRLFLDKFDIENIDNKTVVNLSVVSRDKNSLVSLINHLSTKYKEANTDSINKNANSYKAVIKVFV